MPTRRSACSCRRVVNPAKPAAVTFVRVPNEDKSVVEIEIIRHGKSVGTIKADRHETHRAINGNGTYCTGAWDVSFWDENGRDIKGDFEFGVEGFRPARRWPSYAEASTPAAVAAALREAKAAAVAWLNAHPDYR